MGFKEQLIKELEAAGVRKPKRSRAKKKAAKKPRAKKRVAKKKAAVPKYASEALQDPTVIHAFAKGYLAHGLKGAPAARELFPKLTPKQCEDLAFRIKGSEMFKELFAKEVKKAADIFDENTEGCVRELINHMDSTPLDYVEQDDEGNLVIRKDLHTLDRPVQRRIRSLKVKTTEIENEGRVTKTQQVDVQTVDVQKALHGLCLRFGAYTPDSGSEGGKSLSEQLEEQLNWAKNNSSRLLEGT